MSSEYKKPDDSQRAHQDMKKDTRKGELIGKSETLVEFNKRISHDYDSNMPLDEAVTLMVEGHNLNCAISYLPEIEAGYLVRVSVFYDFVDENRPPEFKYSLLDKFVFDGENVVNLAKGAPEVARVGDFALYPKNNYSEFSKGVPKVQLQIAAYWPGNLEAPAHETNARSDTAKIMFGDDFLSDTRLDDIPEAERKRQDIMSARKHFPFNKAE